MRLRLKPIPNDELFTPQGQHSGGIIKVTKALITQPNCLHVAFDWYSAKPRPVGSTKTRNGHDTMDKLLPDGCPLLEQKPVIDPDQVGLVKLPLGETFEHSWSDAPFLLNINPYCRNCGLEHKEIFQECVRTPFIHIISTFIGATNTLLQKPQFTENNPHSNMFRTQLQQYEQDLQGFFNESSNKSKPISNL